MHRPLTASLLVLTMLLALVGSMTYSLSESDEDSSLTVARSGATAWLHDRAEAVGNAGSHSSMEIAPDGSMWIAHVKDGDLHVTNNADGYWLTEQVYSFGETGRMANLQLDSNGLPRVAHIDITNHVLRISRHDGNSWSTTTVAPGEDTGDQGPYTDNIGRIGFRVGTDGTEHYSYYTGDYDLAYSSYDGTTWSTQIIDDGQGESEDYDGYSRMGRWSDLVIGTSGQPEVAYTGYFVDATYNPVTNQIEDAWYMENVRHAILTPGGWTVNTIIDNETGDFSTEYLWIAAGQDASGMMHIAYQNRSLSRESVWMATQNSGSWNIERVSQGIADGFFVRLAFDSSDSPRIAWYDESLEDAVIMRKESGSFVRVTVASSGDVGQHLDLALNSNDEEILSYHDATDLDLMVSIPGVDADGDGIVDSIDRCPGSPSSARTDSIGCDWTPGELSTDTDDFAYLESTRTSDGTLYMVLFEGYEKGTTSCDHDPGTNMNDSDDCNLVIFTMGTSASERVVIDSEAESGRYADVVSIPSSTASLGHIPVVSYMHISDRTLFGSVNGSEMRIAERLNSGQWDTTTLHSGNSTGWYTSIAVSANGTLAATWVDLDEDATVWISMNYDGTWMPAEVVAVNATFPRVGFLGEDPVVFHRDITNTDIVMSSKDTSGWSSEFIADQPTNYYRPDLATGPDGTLYYVFQKGYDSASGDADCDSFNECSVLMVHHDGTQMSMVRAIGSADPSQGVYPSIDVDAAGRAHVSWYAPDDLGITVSAEGPAGWEEVTVTYERASGRYSEMTTNENGWETVFTFDQEANGTIVYLERNPTEEDHDLVNDDDDLCPNTPFGELVDDNGCGESQRDTDNDGVLDINDLCPFTNSIEASDVNSDGCGASQRDTDGDGVNDAMDECPGTPDATTVDNKGCDEANQDTDGDGISDVNDLCPDTPYWAIETIDSDGCALSEKDSDGDGAYDDFDKFPQDPTQIYDSDNDGYGDNESGNAPDGCPFEAGTSTGSPAGCPDLDSDGIADTVDDDIDGDGVVNEDDAFPVDSFETIDTDGDAFGDNMDPDDDGDGHSDVEEVDCGSDPLDLNSIPPDADGDGTCDALETAGNGDDTPTDGGEAEGMNAMVIGGAVGIVVVIIAGIVGAMMFLNKDEDAPLATSTAGTTNTTQTEGQQGQMIPTGKNCTLCNSPGVVHIPAYGRDYCSACGQYL